MPRPPGLLGDLQTDNPSLIIANTAWRLVSDLLADAPVCYTAVYGRVRPIAAVSP